MNNDLISREALNEKIEELIGYSLSYEAILNAIDNAPTVVNFNTDELCRLRSDLKTGLVVGSTLRYQYQIDRYIKTLDEIISVNMRKGGDD